MNAGTGHRHADVVMALAEHRARTAALLGRLDALTVVALDDSLISAGTAALRSTDDELGRLVGVLQGWCRGCSSASTSRMTPRPIVGRLLAITGFERLLQC
jgi:hypothetical protein